MGYLLENCLFDKLSTELIDQCQPYKCSKDPDIDSFFHNDTKDNYSDYSKEMMGYSHCFYKETPASSPSQPPTKEMVSAFSLSHSALRTAPLPRTKKNRFNKSIPNNKRRSQYPAILIGQLCVFDNFSHKGVGDEMMDLIKTLAIDKSNNCAARYLVVDATNKSDVLSYYERNGFKYLFSSDKEELECMHNHATDSILVKIKRHFMREPASPVNCKTRLMYFDLILLSQ